MVKRIRQSAFNRTPNRCNTLGIGKRTKLFNDMLEDELLEDICNEEYPHIFNDGVLVDITPINASCTHVDSLQPRPLPRTNPQVNGFNTYRLKLLDKPSGKLIDLGQFVLCEQLIKRITLYNAVIGDNNNTEIQLQGVQW